MRGITLIFSICAAASLIPVHAEDDAIHGTEGTAVNNPHIDIARVKPMDLTAPAFRLGEGQVDLTRACLGPLALAVLGRRRPTLRFLAIHLLNAMERGERTRRRGDRVIRHAFSVVLGLAVATR
jgi:hypothetical protein